jgi:hypothetical protein
VPRHALGEDFRWHISVAGEDAVPKWRDLVAIAHAIKPGVFFVVGVPPRSMWMNVNPNTLHLMELRDPNLEHNFEENATGQAPS